MQNRSRDFGGRMKDDVSTTVPGQGHDYYASISYWNHFPLVYRRLNRRATGDEDKFWYQSLLDEGYHFRRALILNCGNGWVERELFRIGLLDSAVGIDISPELLGQARIEASELNLQVEYVEIDINVEDLPEGPFDLVLNHAACHHIASLDRVLRQISESLSPTGIFVNWDYVGPHRNQYTAQQWEAAWETNRRLPVALQSGMQYPDIDTMLLHDPTEAVHSELIVPTVERYFDINLYRPLGGAIGYLVLTHNMPFYSLPEEKVIDHVRYVMDADEDFLALHPEASLFAYFIGQPKSTKASAVDLSSWTAEEMSREQNAMSTSGEYYDRTFLHHVLKQQSVHDVDQLSWQRTLAKRFPRLADAYHIARTRLP